MPMEFSSSVGSQGQSILGCLLEEFHHPHKLVPIILIGCSDLSCQMGNGWTNVGFCSLAGKWTLCCDSVEELCLCSVQLGTLLMNLEWVFIPPCPEGALWGSL